MTDTKTENPLARYGISSPGNVDPHIKALIYGESGVGKTTVVASAADVQGMCPVLHLDVERGTRSIQGIYDNIDVIRVKTIADLQKVYLTLRKGGHGYKTVNVDNLSEIQQLGLGDIIRDDSKADKPPDPDSFVDVTVAEWKNYNKSTEQVRRIVRLFRELDMNVLFTAHRTEVTNKEGDVTKIRPYLTNKASQITPGFIDEVWYMYIKHVKGKQRRIILTDSTDVIVAKTRNHLPTTIEEPTMELIHQHTTEDK